MSSNTIGVPELFSLLESNKPSDADDTKKVFHEHFLSTKDSWLVNGLFEYYLSTNSMRANEVLAGVREPHDKHLLDRLTEVFTKSSTPGQKLQTLTLLGHVARRQPTWLYKLANHQLFKELLKLLKMEGDTLSLMSALLLLVTLLPMLPVSLVPHLHEIFEVFARLVSFYYSKTTQLSLMNSTFVEWDKFYLLHLQVGLYSLFHRLYAMYPCNFVTYLKQQYQRDQDSIFLHTVKPMLESVRMHPLLITMSKDAEISSQRWKKMEHHDVVVECGKFTLDRNREEIIIPSINPRFTPNPDYQYPGSDTIGEDDTFWSPSMVMQPNSPLPLQTQPHEIRSTPSTPGNKSRTSPPEAAVEATPETTPVKDSRQIPSRQPIGSSAVRALGAFGNGVLGVNSRPSTPNSTLVSNFMSGGGDGNSLTSSIISQKFEKLESDRTNFQFSKSKNVSNIVEKLSEIDISQNGKNDSWQEDQEVLEIVSSRDGKSSGSKYLERRLQMNDFGKNPNFQIFCPISQTQIPKEGYCVKIEKKKDCVEQNKSKSKKTEEIGTQTSDFVPYEHLLNDVLYQKNLEASSESRLSPTTILDRYIETCARRNSLLYDCNKSRSNMPKGKLKKMGGEDEPKDENLEEEGLDRDCGILQLQLVQMQLQFERQRREVHAERNRRLLGKLRDSRVVEECTVALNDRLRILEKENGELKTELEQSKAETRLNHDQYLQGLQHWQSKCVEEQQQNQIFKDKIEALEIELKSERKKLSEGERKLQSLEADLFDAGHQLRDALIAANYTNELKKKLCTIKKKFLLFREAQIRFQQERTDFYTKEAKGESAEMLQRSYADELLTLRKQVEHGKAHVEALRNRLGELENKEARKENQLIDQQRLLLEAKERHELELQAVESKYQAQMEINLLLQGKILELHGKIEAATARTGSVTNLASSASPKERSPLLSASLASSSECSLALSQSNSRNMINDCCDPAGEIPNLHAIIEPHPSQVMTPTRSNQHR